MTCAVETAVDENVHRPVRVPNAPALSGQYPIRVGAVGLRDEAPASGGGGGDALLGAMAQRNDLVLQAAWRRRRRLRGRRGPLVRRQGLLIQEHQSLASGDGGLEGAQDHRVERGAR